MSTGLFESQCRVPWRKLSQLSPTEAIGQPIAAQCQAGASCIALAGQDGTIRVHDAHPPFRLRFAFAAQNPVILSMHYCESTHSIVTLEKRDVRSSVPVKRAVAIYTIHSGPSGEPRVLRSNLPLDTTPTCIAVCGVSARIATAFSATVRLWDCSMVRSQRDKDVVAHRVFVPGITREVRDGKESKSDLASASGLALDEKSSDAAAASSDSTAGGPTGAAAVSAVWSRHLAAWTAAAEADAAEEQEESLALDDDVVRESGPLGSGPGSSSSGSGSREAAPVRASRPGGGGGGADEEDQDAAGGASASSGSGGSGGGVELPEGRLPRSSGLSGPRCVLAMETSMLIARMDLCEGYLAYTSAYEARLVYLAVAYQDPSVIATAAETRELELTAAVPAQAAVGALSALSSDAASATSLSLSLGPKPAAALPPITAISAAFPPVVYQPADSAAPDSAVRASALPFAAPAAAPAASSSAAAIGKAAAASGSSGATASVGPGALVSSPTLLGRQSSTGEPSVMLTGEGDTGTGKSTADSDDDEEEVQRALARRRLEQQPPQRVCVDCGFDEKGLPSSSSNSTSMIAIPFFAAESAPAATGAAASAAADRRRVAGSAEKRLRNRKYPFELLQHQPDTSHRVVVNTRAGYSLLGCLGLYHRRFLSSDRIQVVSILRPHEAAALGSAAAGAGTSSGAGGSGSAAGASAKQIHQDARSMRLFLSTSLEGFLYDVTQSIKLATYTYEDDLLRVAVESSFLYALTTKGLEVYTLWTANTLTAALNLPTLLWRQRLPREMEDILVVDNQILLVPRNATVDSFDGELPDATSGPAAEFELAGALENKSDGKNLDLAALFPKRATTLRRGPGAASPLLSALPTPSSPASGSSGSAGSKSSETSSSSARMGQWPNALLVLQRSSTAALYLALAEQSVSSESRQLAVEAHCMLRQSLAKLRSVSAVLRADDVSVRALSVRVEEKLLSRLLPRSFGLLGDFFFKIPNLLLAAQLFVHSDRFFKDVMTTLRSAGAMAIGAMTEFLSLALVAPSPDALRLIKQDASFANNTVQHFAQHAPLLLSTVLVSTSLFWAPVDVASALTSLNDLFEFPTAVAVSASGGGAGGSSALSKQIRGSGSGSGSSKGDAGKIPGAPAVSSKAAKLKAGPLDILARAVLLLQCKQADQALQALQTLAPTQFEELLIANSHLLQGWTYAQQFVGYVRKLVPWSLLEVVSALTVRSILAPNDAMAVLSGGISGGSSGDGDSKDKEVASAAAAEFAVLRLSYLESSLQRARPADPVTRELATRLALSYIAQLNDIAAAKGDRKLESKGAGSAAAAGSLSAEFVSAQEAWLAEHKFALWPRHPWLDAATASGRAGFLPEVPPSSLIRLQSLLSSALPRDDAAVHDAVMAMDNGFSGKLSLILLTLPRLGRLTDALAMLVNLDLSLVMPFAQHQCTEASHWAALFDFTLRRLIPASSAAAGSGSSSSSAVAIASAASAASAAASAAASSASAAASASSSALPAALVPTGGGAPRIGPLDQSGQPMRDPVAAYHALLTALLQQTVEQLEPEQFLAVIPDNGSTRFFLPYIERSFARMQSRLLRRQMLQTIDRG